MNHVVGIDLGTTNSCIAHIDEYGKPYVMPNREGNKMTPSVICFRGNEVLIGEDAKDVQALGRYPVAAFFKRQIGDRYFVFHAGNRDHTATDLSALLLKRLKRDAETYLNEKVTQAVITVPAYFREAERKATIAAGAAAGLDVIQVINEPTAAAIAYGVGKQGKSLRVMVYDLGGGTFDATLLELSGGALEVRASGGDHQLGGKDWDDRIIEFLVSRFEDEFGRDPLEDAESLADLLIQAEEAKKKLTSVEKASVSITHDSRRGKYTLSRSKFEELTRDLMERTISLVMQVLEDAKTAPADMDGILTVGGSTRMPMVHAFINERFGRAPVGGINVDEAVALGAAVVANQQVAETRRVKRPLGLAGSITIKDVTNHSLGMIAINGDHSAYVNSIILPKNTGIPSTETRPYQHRTRNRGENELEVFLTQGESEAPDAVSYLGKYVIKDIPHQTGSTVVDIQYHYDVSGTVNVSARARGTSNDLKIVVEQLPDDVPARFLESPELQLEVPEHVTAYIAIDMSGSMNGDPLREAKKAALQFLHNVDLSHCSIGVIAFSDTVLTKLQASQNARTIEKAINGLTECETGVCNAAHPFDEIKSLLKRTSGRRFAITLADGVWENQDLAVQRAKLCHDAEIDIIAIGFGGADKRFLSQIASSDEASFFTSMSGLTETFSTIAQVMTENTASAPAVGPVHGRKASLLAGIQRALKR